MPHCRNVLQEFLLVAGVERALTAAVAEGLVSDSLDTREAAAGRRGRQHLLDNFRDGKSRTVLDRRPCRFSALPLSP